MKYIILLLVCSLAGPLLIAQSPDVFNTVATGHFPDLAVDREGNVHLVYHREGLKYKRFNAANGEWEAEQDVACHCEWVARQDPDIVTDNRGRPHVFCGNYYARLENGSWRYIPPFKSTDRIRDAELVINEEDMIFLVHRGGFQGGHIGLQSIPADGDIWKRLPDPDHGDDYGNISDHIYADLEVSPSDNSLHLVQRHGPDKPYEIAYRTTKATENGWIRENVDEDREEAPHITVDHDRNVYISTGSGLIFRRSGKDNWTSEGRPLHAEAREQPELCSDRSGNIYLCSFGGKFNIRRNGQWGEQRTLPRENEESVIGFVESFGLENTAIITWEEGDGNANDGLSEFSRIRVAILQADGRIRPLP